MKLLKIMTALITLITFSGCSTKYIQAHVDFIPSEQCVFEKLTEAEKKSMAESAKMKVGRNYKGCFIRQEAENKRINEHNNLHSGK